MMSRVLPIALTLSLALSGVPGCAAPSTQSPADNNQLSASFTSMSDTALLQYAQDEIFANLESSLGSDDYVIEDIQTIYVSKEYLEEVAYNNRSNIYFGYSLEEIESSLGDQKYVFTVDTDGKTTTEGFQEFDDTFEKTAINLAVGGGVILVCIVVSAATAGGATPITAPTVSMVFAASAKTAAVFATGSGALGFAAGGISKAIETDGDLEEALKAALAQGGEDFKWGALIGAAAGGAGKAIQLGRAAKAIPTWRESEQRALKLFPGEEQIAYLNGKRVPYNTAGATRPDIVSEEGGKLIATEVKNYNLETNLQNLTKELERQVSERVQHLPEGSAQRIALDVRNKNYSETLVENAINKLDETLSPIEPNITIVAMK